MSGLDLIRSRDCQILRADIVVPAKISTTMKNGGWAGGQGVMWSDSGSGDLEITYSDGRFGGFVLWGSTESSDEWAAYTNQSKYYGYTLVGISGWMVSTIAYEKYSLQSRLSGPLIELVYTPSDILFFSSRGLWTNQDEMAILGSPFTPKQAGHVAQPPSSSNQFRLGLSTTL